ncbi:hypothetical protein ACFCX0_03665 [Streptomyces sp. NPDC056352]|uniref:hypothetical protein n=1 Tax=Streptomyces sp. NPDC056352 TaxID=3345791 RepID=UPI0035DDCE64
MTDQPTPETLPAVQDLRDRVAEALLDHLSRTADIRPGPGGALAFMPEITDAERLRIADAVLAVRDREMERLKLLVAASGEPGHAVRMAAQYADRAIENGERAKRAEDAIARAKTLAERWENGLFTDFPYAEALRAALDQPQQPTTTEADRA